MVRTRNRDYVRNPAVSTKQFKKKTIRGTKMTPIAKMFSPVAADKVKKVATTHKALAKKVVEE